MLSQHNLNKKTKKITLRTKIFEVIDSKCVKREIKSLQIIIIQIKQQITDKYELD